MVKVILSDEDEEMILGPFYSGVAFDNGAIMDIANSRTVCILVFDGMGMVWRSTVPNMKKTYKRAFVQSHDPNTETIPIEGRIR